MSVESQWNPSSLGYLKVQGYRIYYVSFGDAGKKGTILCLHGGPGAAHDYMLPLSDLAKFGYRIVMYDQLGCGKSELPKNKALLSVEHHVEEVEGVRRALGLGKIDLAGSSWGGMLTMEYSFKYAENLKSMILMGGLESTPHYLAEVETLKSKLPSSVRKIIKKYEAVSDYQNPEYLKAVDKYYKRYLCRLAEWPPEVHYAAEQLTGEVYTTMWGDNEFLANGILRYWDISAKLSRIKIPCLILAGEYDEVPPKVTEALHHGIRKSKVVILKNSGHLAMWDGRERLIGSIRSFLESRSSRSK